MQLLGLDLSGVSAAAAFPLVVAHTHVSKVFVGSVPGDMPSQRVTFWAFVRSLGASLTRRLQQFHPFAQGCNFVWRCRDAFPRGPFVQQFQNRSECAHV